MEFDTYLLTFGLLCTPTSNMAAFSIVDCGRNHRPHHYSFNVQGGPKKGKPLPNDQKIVLNRIKACQ